MRQSQETAAHTRGSREPGKRRCANEALCHSLTCTHTHKRAGTDILGKNVIMVAIVPVFSAEAYPHQQLVPRRFLSWFSSLVATNVNSNGGGGMQILFDPLLALKSYGP